MKHRTSSANGKNGGITRAEFLKAMQVIAGRFEAMDRKSDERFQAIDGRFEALQRELHDDLLALQRELHDETRGLRTEIRTLHDWTNLHIGRFNTRAGRRLETTVAGALRFALKRPDIRPDQIKMRQKFADPAGTIGPAGRVYEVDILAQNGDTYVFEVKSTPEAEDVLRFNDKADLVANQLGRESTKKVLVTLAKEPGIVRRCEELGILIV
jgi:hypothetical protein